jgi:hypothetical protein
MSDWKTGTPPDSKPVLAVTADDIAGSNRKRRTIVRAQYIRHKEEESEGCNENENNEWYDDETECYWVTQGWYELAYYSPDYGCFAIDDPVIAWMPMPELPK